MTVTITHDGLFQKLMESPRRAGVVIRDSLPAEILVELSDDPPHPEEGTYLDETCTLTRSDRLFTMRRRDGAPVLLYVLFEHKSEADPRTPVQLLGYMARIWTRYADGRAEAYRNLPPIIPVVVYHGKEEWRVAFSIMDCLIGEGPSYELSRSLEYILYDLGVITLPELPEDPEVRAVLAALKYVFADEVPVEAFAAMLAALPVDHELWHAVALYVLLRYGETYRPAMEAGLRQGDPAQLEAKMATIAEAYRREARAEGKAEGEALGMAKGKAEGEASMLIKMLERRFGPLPEASRHQVMTASGEQIDAWADAVLDAPSLEAVFTATRH